MAQAPSPPRMGAGLDLWETLGGLTFTQRGNVQARAGRTSTSLPEKQHEYSNKWAGLKAGSVLSPIPMPRIDAGLDLWETLGGLASTGRADRRLVGELLVGLMCPLAVQRRLGIDEERLSRIVMPLMELGQDWEACETVSTRARQCLDACLQEQKESDIVILRYGILRSEQSRNAILDRISTRPNDLRRAAAAKVLADVAEAVEQRWTWNTVHMPLQQLFHVLHAPILDRPKLLAQLELIPGDEATLYRYVQFLSDDEFYKLEKIVWTCWPRIVQISLYPGTERAAFAKLENICNACEDEDYRRLLM